MLSVSSLSSAIEGIQNTTIYVNPSTTWLEFVPVPAQRFRFSAANRLSLSDGYGKPWLILLCSSGLLLAT